MSRVSRADSDPRRSVAAPIFSSREWRQLSEQLDLSTRSLEIVQRVFRDETESTIAADLGISSHTVHTYIERLYRRLGVSSRVGLVLCIVSEHLGAPSLEGTEEQPC